MMKMDNNNVNNINNNYNNNNNNAGIDVINEEFHIKFDEWSSSNEDAESFEMLMGYTEFVYNDSDMYLNEIGEFYSYSENVEHRSNYEAFKNRLKQFGFDTNFDNIWLSFSECQKKKFILSLLDTLELIDVHERLISVRCILYLVQGCWDSGINRDNIQRITTENIVFLLKFGIFDLFLELLVTEISFTSNKMQSNSKKIDDKSTLFKEVEIFRVILTVLYTIIETMRFDEIHDPNKNHEIIQDLRDRLTTPFRNELLIIRLFNMLTNFCSNNLYNIPVKKVLLLIWKILLFTLGGMKTMYENKIRIRQKAGLATHFEDTISVAKNFRTSCDHLNNGDYNQSQTIGISKRIRSKRILMKQSSLEDCENDDEQSNVTNFDCNHKNKLQQQQLQQQQQQQQQQQTQTQTKMKPWTTKSREKDILEYLQNMRLKYIGYTLPYDSFTVAGLPNPIIEGIAVLNRNKYISHSELQIKEEENLIKYPLTAKKPEINFPLIEQLYEALLPNLTQYVIALLKILLSSSPTSKSSKSDAMNITSDIFVEDGSPSHQNSLKIDIDLSRHKEIIIKAISALILILLKQFKLNHIYQFEFLSQHLVFSNCIPLVLKFFNQKNILSSYIASKNGLFALDFPNSVLHETEFSDCMHDATNNTNNCPSTTYSICQWRNLFSCINLLRILNKLIKWKSSRVMMLVVFKSAPILKRTLKINNPILQLYVLKLLKMQARYLGRQGRKANMKTISEIYHRKPRDPAIYILLDRNESIQKNRLKLPILYREQEIIQEINANNIVIITGETGCGKTTQLPQFLYEAAYTERNKKLIGVTEPRRVAAISMSKRVGEEMNLINGEVSYLIRFEGNATDQTRIKFMTDGVLMKEIQSDFLLSKYSVIILDEAHERSVYTDILIGLLSRIVPLRAKRNDPLKLVIMSATLCVDHFIKNKHLFRGKRPPVVNVESRQFKVTVHFSRVTRIDYLNEAYKKICQIHSKLPAGGILVFVTGQAEVKYLVRKLRTAYPSRQDNNSENNTLCQNKKQGLPEIDLSQYALPGEEINDSDLEEVNNDNTVESMMDDSDIEYDAMEEMNEGCCGPLWVLPLYSMLSSQEQSKIFQPVPATSRLCVVSTNVAETSLTIPGIHYIVDTGKVKYKLYDKVTGASKYEIDWITKANAEQRAGRAGRQGPGHCYRLYSSAVFQNDFKDFPLSEIEQKPIDDIVLQLKMLHIEKVINFPFPTPPSIEQLQSAEEHLKIMDIIDKKTGQVTALGRKISEFPVSPRFGKMLIIGNQQGILEYVIIIVAALSVPELFDSIIAESEICLKHRVITGEKGSQGRKLGDIMLLLKMIGAAESAHSRGGLEQFCKENNIRHKAAIEIRKMRYQLTKVVNMSIPDVNLTMDPMLKPPNEAQTKLLRQLMLMGSVDKIARKIQTNEVDKEDRIRLKYAYETLDLEEPVYMNTNCILIKELPEYVCYQELYETNKLFMRHVTQIEPNWIPIYARNICSILDPISNTEEYDSISGQVMCRVSGFFGKRNWPLPDILMEHPNDLSLYKHFGKFLLEGKVFQKLEAFVCHLLSSPEILQRTWVKFHEKTEKLLKALLVKGAGCKENLQKVWQTEPMYLLNEYLMWLPESQHLKLKSIWPPLD